MLNPNLAKESEQGRKAKALLQQLQPYLSKVEARLLEEFKHGSIDYVVFLKQQYNALEALVAEITTDIETGFLADQQIESIVNGSRASYQ